MIQSIQAVTASALFAVALAPIPVYAAVEGRFVRVEAPASTRMGIYEIEALTGGRNILVNRTGLIVTGLGYRGESIRERNGAKALTDGKIDRDLRATPIEKAEGVNPWVELDLGRVESLDRLVLHLPKGPSYADRGYRLVSVLSADRRVVFAGMFRMSEPTVRGDGVMALDLEPTPEPIGGMRVEAGVEQWLSLRYVAELREIPPQPDRDDRIGRFADRHSPASIASLSHDFFARLDLTKPELAPIAALYRAGEHRKALDAYRDRFLDRIAGVKNDWGHSIPRRAYPLEADDLMQGVSAEMLQRSVWVFRFEVGAYPWAYVSDNDAERAESLVAAQQTTTPNEVARPLLWAWAETGDDRYMQRWAAITDDWSMNLVADLERSPHNVRSYFVKDPMQSVHYTLFELAQVLRQRPRLREALPSATLARMLIVITEEVPPSYWRQARKMVFNHTFNGLTSAYRCARVLDDFHAGQYLDAEVRRHFDRAWTYAMTSDGSMIEVGDEGHLFMPLVLGRIYIDMLDDPPAWLDEPRRIRFEEGYAMLSRYGVRHLDPGGYGHRVGYTDLAYRVADLTRSVRTFKGGDPVPEFAAPIMRESEVRAIVDTVYGEGREVDALPPSRRGMREFFARYFEGPYAGPPRTVSDWMPYAGLHYLRGGWSPDDSFVHMICQHGRGEANGNTWNTEFRYHDFGYPLLSVEPIRINGRTADLTRGVGYKPGSKTVVLTEAPRKPMDARWLTGARFDLAESFVEGPFQDRVTDPADRQPPVAEGRVTRQVIQVRAARCLIVTDRAVLRGPARELDYSMPTLLRAALRGEDPAEPTITADAAGKTLGIRNASTPGVTVSYASGNAVGYAPIRPGDARSPRSDRYPADLAFASRGLYTRWRAVGDDVLVSLVAPNRADEEPTVRVVDRPVDEATVGVDAEFPGGGRIFYRAARRDAAAFRLGPIDAAAEAILLVTRGDERTGLALGVRSLRIAGKGIVLTHADFEFEIVGDEFRPVAPILRPIDPVTISPAVNVFTDHADVTMSTATADADIHYTLDGGDPTRSSAKYAGPVRIDATTFIRARAFRRGSEITEAPFTTAGTLVSRVSDARFTRVEPTPAAGLEPAALEAGLDYDYIEDNWFRLFSIVDVLPATASGKTDRLMDVSMRRTDGPFAVRYSGYLDVPADGVYSFHAPREFVRNELEPGYDLRLWIDGVEWDLDQTWHAMGTWSAALQKGPHRFVLCFADARATDIDSQRRDLWRDYPTPWVVWRGESPVVEVSGPGVERRAIPDAWLKRAVKGRR